MTNSDDPSGKLHAILIGVDYYLPGTLADGRTYCPSLRGCVRDIEHVERLLVEQVGIPAERITKLSAANPRDGEQEPREPAELRPTYENMVHAFDHITQTADPGDWVYVHWAHRQRLQRQLGRGHRARERQPWSERKGRRHQPRPTEPTEASAEALRGGHNERVQLIRGLGACLDCRSASRLEYPQHLDRSVASFGLCGRRSSLHRARRCLGIDHIGLATTSPILTFRSLHLQNLNSATAQPAGEPGAIAAGALDSKSLDRPQSISPCDEGPVTRWC
jgi:hypothetical protein